MTEPRYTADTINDDALDALYERAERYDALVALLRSMTAPRAAAAINPALHAGWRDALVCVQAHLDSTAAILRKRAELAGGRSDGPQAPADAPDVPEPQLAPAKPSDARTARQETP